MIARILLVTALLLTSPALAALNQGVSGIAVEELFPGAQFDPGIPTQEEVTGHSPAQRPLRPDEILRYFRTLAEVSPRAKLTVYARSHEGRDLVYLAVGEPDLIARLDDFHQEHVDRLDPRLNVEPAFDGVKAVAWMAYGIHGDELSSPDAAAALAYWLVAGEDARARSLRENLLVLIDPCENPDGRTRYLAQTVSFAHATANPDLEDLSHASVWPWGRGNHYLFDMNRDWFAMVHPESARAEVIGSWLPQLMVDSHEMGGHDTYLFSPPRHPFNPHLPESNRGWRIRFGEDQARALDGRGYPYYTAEWNEEFFPGYGSSWATYHGSVGILYEMSRTTGTLVKKKSGTVRTFAQAVEHQVTSSVANLETLASNRTALLSDHLESRLQAMEKGRDGPIRCWVLPYDDRHPGRMEKIAGLLRKQQIEILRLAGPAETADLHDARTGETPERLTLQSGSILVRLDQPAARIARVLLDPHVPMGAEFLREEREYLEKGKGSRLYDTTAWSLPLAYGIPAYWGKKIPEGDWREADPAPETPAMLPASFASVIIDGSPDNSVAVLADLLQNGVTVHAAEKPFRIDGRAFDRGALVVRREGNREGLAELLGEISRRHGVEMFPVSSSKSTGGPDLGGRHFKPLVAPRAGVWTGSPVSSTSYGSLWHMLDLEIGLRFSGLDLARFRRVDLDRYNVLVFPPVRGGWKAYEQILGKKGIKRLQRWIEAGGTAIGIDSGARFLADREFGLTEARFRSQALKEHPAAVYGISAQQAELAGPMRGAGLRPAENEGVIPVSPYDVAPLIGPGARPFVDLSTIGTPIGGRPISLEEWLKPVAGNGKNGPTEKDVERADKRLARFMPRGALLRVDLDTEFWMNFGLGTDATVWVSGSPAIVAEPPVKTTARFAGIEDLHRGGLLWPEGAGRIAQTAYATREAVGRGQVILFVDDPSFRGWMHESRRMFANAILLGPGLGTKWSAPW